MDGGRGPKRSQKPATSAFMSPVAGQKARVFHRPNRVHKRLIKPFSRLTPSVSGDKDQKEEHRTIPASKRARELWQHQLRGQTEWVSDSEISSFDLDIRPQSDDGSGGTGGQEIPVHKSRTKWDPEVWCRRSQKEVVQGQDDVRALRARLGNDLEPKQVKADKIEGEYLDKGTSEM